MAEYYMPAEDESALVTFKNRLFGKKRPRPSFPRAIQIQTDSRCNARCVFCGYTDTHKSLPQGAMDEDLFKKIIDECGKHWIGRISPYLMNEPLMDRNLPDKIAYINARRKPITKTKINSNGALLTEDMSEGLVKAGLRHLWISVQGYSEETYRQSMNLSLAKTLDNIDRFLDIRAKHGAKLPKLTITTLKTKIVADEIDYAYKYWGERDVRFKVHKVDNRSGKNLKDLGSSKPKLRRNCDLFLKQAYVLYNGDVIICCHDWRRTVVLGNLNEQGLAEIWNSQRFVDVIRQYQAGDFTNCAICRTCSVS